MERSPFRGGVFQLLNYDWPGNIRELCNVIQRAAIFAQGGALQFDLQMANPSVELTSQKPAIADDSNAGYLTVCLEAGLNSVAPLRISC